MSFDTVFNYASVVNGLTTEQNNNETALFMVTDALATLQSANAYANEPIVIDKITSLQADIIALTNRKKNINEVLSEITMISALPNESKDKLLYFYTVVNPTKQEYMAKMLFNYKNALNDARITNLIADTITPSSAKKIIANIIYSSYSILTENQYTMAVYRYPN